MNKILIDAVYPQETRVVKISEDNKVLNFDYESSAKKQLKGNIYLARVSRVEPSLQAAFVEYGENKHGFLPFSEIHFDYFQVPAEDRKKLEEAIKKNDSAQEEQEQHAKGKKSASSSRLSKIAQKAEDDDLVETSAEDLEKRRKNLIKSYKIQEVIKKNQVILVQVIKEERGNKGVSLSTYITLAGRYCVLMPNSGTKSGGISRRIESAADRKRLRDLVRSFKMPDGTSIILRTAVLNHSDEEIKADYNFLVSTWNNIRQETLKSSAPALINAEADVIKRSLRDLFDEATEEIIVEGSAAVALTKKLLKAAGNEDVKKVKEHKAKQAIFNHYNVEDEINSFYSTNASLTSGGYLVINITEALISIDVNSGRATKQRSVEETALKTNLEAAKEVARQLRLRDLSGLIVVDFIDMIELENRKKLERSLRAAFEGDRARIQISRVSNLGLVEMSRQRLKPSLVETNTMPCPNCGGTGFVKSYENLSVDVFREIRRTVVQKSIKMIKVYASPGTISYLINFRRKNLEHLEQEHGINVFLYVDNNLRDAQFRVDTAKDISTEDKELLENDKSSAFELDDVEEVKPKKTAKNSKNTKSSKAASKTDNKGNLVSKIFNKIK